MRLITRNAIRFASQKEAHINQSQSHFTFAKDIPSSLPREHMNLFKSINSAIDVALATDPT